MFNSQENERILQDNSLHRIFYTFVVTCMLKQEIEDTMKLYFLIDLRFSIYLMRKIHIYNVK